MVRPLAYRDSTTSSTPGSRRCRFLTTTGSNEPSRSRGTSILTGPTESVTTVLAVVPLRVFAALPSLDFLCLARPRCSVISSSRAVSSTLLVNCLSSPSGPVRSSPFFLGHAHECERCLPLGVAFFRVRLLRRCHVSPCPSRHRPPAFPTGHTTGQLRPVTHFERQSRAKD